MDTPHGKPELYDTTDTFRRLPLPPIFCSQCFPSTLALRVSANIIFLVRYTNLGGSAEVSNRFMPGIKRVLLQQEIETRLHERGLSYTDGGQTLFVEPGECVSIESVFDGTEETVHVEPPKWVCFTVYRCLSLELCSH